MTSDSLEPTLEQLEQMNRRHLKDLRLLRHMTEAQFRVFRRNISIGIFDDMSKSEAHEILVSMLALNQQLISEAKSRISKKT